MKSSRRLARMQRKHAHRKHPIPLNLVSLIDIFTVLVFFLLVNFGDVTLLSEARDLELPMSSAEQKPKDSIVVVVSRHEVIVGGKAVARVADIEASTDPAIPALQEALRRQLLERPVDPGTPPGTPRSVTILGDKGTSYAVLKKVMQNCSVENVGKIALAVTPKGAVGELSLDY